MNNGADDAYLVSRAREGFVDAFEVLVVRHRERAYRVALRTLDDPADAEDVTQEAFVDAWRGLPSFSGASAFSTWFYRILVNRCLQHRRARRAGPLSVPLGSIEPATLQGGSRPEEVAEARGRSQALREAIAALPDELRTPLVLHQFGEFSYDEIAAMLDVPPATVRGRIYRARRGLYAAMKEWS
jgi:RNA polymerase sigma-70 factor (ECF subfamily)